MSKKNYEAFANMLASHENNGNLPDGEGGVWNKGYEYARLDIGRSIAAVLTLDNPNFDAVRFYEAAKL